MQKRATSTVSAGRKTNKPESEKAPTVAAKQGVPPSREEITRRAHEIYVARGQVAGHEMEDWLQAERELTLAVGRNK